MTEQRSEDPRLSEVVSRMAHRWSEEAIVFLDGEDHDEFATGLVIAALIQMARALMDDNNAEQRAMWIKVLSADGVGIELGSTQ